MLDQYFKQPDSWSQAYVVLGDPSALIDNLVALARDKIQSADEIFIHDRLMSPSLTVEEVRDFVSRHNSRLQTNERKLLVLGSERLSIPVQNMLLKTLEEPPQNTHYIVITMAAHTVLPTIRSRTVMIDVRTGTAADSDLPTVQEFVQMTIADRLEIIGKLFKDKDTAPSRSRVANFVGDLQQFLVKSNHATDTEVLLKMNTIQDYLSDAGSSAKMWLEWIAVWI
jgi:hypothetical protein